MSRFMHGTNEYVYVDYDRIAFLSVCYALAGRINENLLHFTYALDRLFSTLVLI